MKLKQQILLIIGLAMVVYFTSLFNQFIWDDEQFIYKNSYVLNFEIEKIFTTNTIAGAGQMSDYYRPLTTLSFAIDHAIWGLLPFGFHITNLALHTSAAILILLLLREFKLHQSALAIASLFLLHPIQTEAVSYINSRGDSLYVFFSLLSLWTLILTLKKESASKSKIWFLVASSLCYLGAILAKEIGIITYGLQVLVVLIYQFHLNHDFKKTWSQLVHNQHINLYLLGNFAIGISYMWLRATALNFQNSFNLYHGDNLYTSNIIVRLLTFSKILWIYFKLLIFPYPLYMDRSTNLVTSLVSIWPWITSFLCILIIILVTTEYRKSKTAWILLGSCWFLICLAPVSGIIPINGLLYEHWLYFPGVGFFIFLYGCWSLFNKPFKKLMNYFLFLILIIFSILTIRQNWFWRSPISLYKYLLKYTNTARIHNNLAMAYSDEKEFELAIKHYQAAINLSDTYPQTHHNLARLYAEQGNLLAAEQEYKKAIELNPNFYFSYLPLIDIYIKEKKNDEAQELLKPLIKLEPNNPTILQLKSKISS